MTCLQPITRIAACAAAALCTACAWASTATATTLNATCSNVQERINEAAKSAGADTVVLNGMCKAGATLPKEASFTLQGAPGTTSGFDGEGTSGPLLSTPELAGAMTIENMTFEHARRTSSTNGGDLDVDLRQLTLRNDEFVDDTDETAAGANGGGAFVDVEPSSGASCQPGEPPALTVTGSTFLEDRAVSTGAAVYTDGGGLYAFFHCGGRTSVVEGDVFERDHVEAKGSVGLGGLTAGGGLALLSFTTEHGGTLPVQQRSDVFDSNAVSGPTSANDGGGGEWLEGMSLASVGDRFSRNSLTGTTGSAWSWGGGLGILGTECNENPTESALEDAVVAANSIGAGTPADLGGAGIYVGCEGANVKSSNHLRLLDSTVTANSVATAGGVAGIEGHSQDQLAIANSIVAGNAGAQLRGFTGAGGSLSSQFSDVCDEAGTAPLAGAGNICADPKLADDGSTSSYDVHESPASPTIDAGSNALVAGGLTTDFFGAPRVQPSHAVLPPCSPGATIGYVPGPAVVDMGAAEYGPVAVPAIAFVCLSATKPSSVFAFPAVHIGRGGELRLTFKGLPTGRVSVKGTFKRTRIVVERVKGHRRRVRRTQTVVYGSTAFTVTTTRSARTVRLKPSRTALAYLKAHRKLSLRLTITFTATGAVPSTQHKTILVRYVKPPAKRR